MTATILDGKIAAEKVYERVRRKAGELAARGVTEADAATAIETTVINTVGGRRLDDVLVRHLAARLTGARRRSR